MAGPRRRVVRGPSRGSRWRKGPGQGKLPETKGRYAVELKLATRDEGGRTVVDISGEIDVYTAPTLREHLGELVAGGKYDLVLDLEHVAFLDSTGLGVLVGGLKRVRAHDGSLHLVCSQERILKVFRITGLTKVFPIHDSVPDALGTQPA